MALNAKEQWEKWVSDTKHDLQIDVVMTKEAELFIDFLNLLSAGINEKTSFALVDLAIKACEELEYQAQNAQDNAIQEQEYEAELETEKNRGKIDDYDFDYLSGIGSR